MLLAESGDNVMNLKNTHKRDVYRLDPQTDNVDEYRASQAMASSEAMHVSNGDEAASTGTSSSAISSTAASSSSSSLSSSSSSLSNGSSAGVNKGGCKGINLCKRPLWQQNTHHPIGVRNARPAQVSGRQYLSTDVQSKAAPDVEVSTTSKIFKALLISKRRLRFEPSSKLYFPYEPGKQSTSAVRIRNVSHSSVAFKFQTTSPKSCFMRPPTGVLSPGDSLVAVVVKFIELPKSLEQDKEVPLKRRTRDKFKIVSMKIHEGLEFTPELFEEHKEQVAVEQILQVVLLDPRQPSHQLERLKGLIAEAEAAQEAQGNLKGQKPDSANTKVADVSVLEEWRQRKLARQQAK